MRRKIKKEVKSDWKQTVPAIVEPTKALENKGYKTALYYADGDFVCIITHRTPWEYRGRTLSQHTVQSDNAGFFISELQRLADEL